MNIYEFEAEIIEVDDMDAAYIEFPYDVETLFNKKRVKVCVFLNLNIMKEFYVRWKQKNIL